MDCILCDEPMLDERSRTVQPMHRECGLRSVMGGIGHLIDHAHFCKGELGPDAGLPYRLSALLCDTWVRYKGVEDAVRESQVADD